MGHETNIYIANAKMLAENIKSLQMVKNNAFALQLPLKYGNLSQHD